MSFSSKAFVACSIVIVVVMLLCSSSLAETEVYYPETRLEPLAASSSETTSILPLAASSTETTSILPLATTSAPNGTAKGISCFSNTAYVFFECGGSWAGTCDTSIGSCVCRYGWTGDSDFYTMNTRPWGGKVRGCQTNVMAIRILWSLVLFQFIYVLLWLLPLATRDQLRAYRNAVPKMKRWLEHKPLVLIVLDVFSVFAACSMCVYKIFWPVRDVLVMIDILPTHLFMIPLAMAFGMAYAYEHYMLSIIILSPAHRTDMRGRGEMLAFETKMLQFGWASLAISALPVLVVPCLGEIFGVHRSREHVNVQDVVFFAATAIGLVSVAQLCRRLKHHTRNLFRILKSNAVGRRANLRQLRMTEYKLLEIQDTFIFHLLFQGVCLGLLITIPVLWSKASYIFPSLYFSVARVNAKAVKGYTFFFFYTDDNGGNSAGGGGGGGGGGWGDDAETRRSVALLSESRGRSMMNDLDDTSRQDTRGDRVDADGLGDLLCDLIEGEEEEDANDADVSRRR